MPSNLLSGGYCFQCGTYRPSKHTLRDEELDAASFMESNFGKRLRIFYAETDQSDVIFDYEEFKPPEYRPRILSAEEAPRRTSPTTQAPSPPPTPSVINSPPQSRPEMPLTQRIASINSGRNPQPAKPQLSKPQSELTLTERIAVINFRRNPRVADLSGEADGEQNGANVDTGIAPEPVHVLVRPPPLPSGGTPIVIPLPFVKKMNDNITRVMEWLGRLLEGKG